MKKKDYMLLIIVAIVSAAMSILISNVFISSEANRSQTAEEVVPISAEFKRPPKEYYNDSSNNPTQIIQIGPGSNESKPFGSQ